MHRAFLHLFVQERNTYPSFIHLRKRFSQKKRKGKRKEMIKCKRFIIITTKKQFYKVSYRNRAQNQLRFTALAASSCFVSPNSNQSSTLTYTLSGFTVVHKNTAGKKKRSFQRHTKPERQTETRYILNDGKFCPHDP